MFSKLGLTSGRIPDGPIPNRHDLQGDEPAVQAAEVHPHGVLGGFSSREASGSSTANGWAAVAASPSPRALSLRHTRDSTAFTACSISRSYGRDREQQRGARGSSGATNRNRGFARRFRRTSARSQAEVTSGGVVAPPATMSAAPNF